nr:unnamed protein product [Callosobruchus chinensis]
MILSKGRSSIKQYNPMKPIKRGYKIWCVADQKGYVSKFEVYQGKNEELEKEFSSYGLGERVVLSLTKMYWGQSRILYFDNYFTSIPLLEKLRVNSTLACGTIRSNRKEFPKALAEDKSLKRADFDYRYSNTNIGIYKWKDNRVVHLATNFHGTEETTVQRTEKNGSKLAVKCPTVVEDYTRHMGGVDHADQLRATYGLNRKSKKWWHRLLWGFIEMAFINAYIIYCESREKIRTLEFRRSVSQGLIIMSETKGKRKILNPVIKRRKYNYSVSDDVRLGNRGSHWVIYDTKRNRCEYCSAQGIQSRPHSKCSSCATYLIFLFITEQTAKAEPKYQSTAAAEGRLG